MLTPAPTLSTPSLSPSSYRHGNVESDENEEEVETVEERPFVHRFEEIQLEGDGGEIWQAGDVDGGAMDVDHASGDDVPHATTEETMQDKKVSDDPAIYCAIPNGGGRFTHQRSTDPADRGGHHRRSHRSSRRPHPFPSVCPSLQAADLT